MAENLEDESDTHVMKVEPSSEVRVVLEDFCKSNLNKMWKQVGRNAEKTRMRIAKKSMRQDQVRQEVDNLCLQIHMVEKILNDLKDNLDFVKAKKKKEEDYYNGGLGPWTSNNVNDYRYYMCQECDFVTRQVHQFISHIRYCHAMGRQVFEVVKQEFLEQDEEVPDDPMELVAVVEEELVAVVEEELLHDEDVIKKDDIKQDDDDDEAPTEAANDMSEIQDNVELEVEVESKPTKQTAKKRKKPAMAKPDPEPDYTKIISRRCYTLSMNQDQTSCKLTNNLAPEIRLDVESAMLQAPNIGMAPPVLDISQDDYSLKHIDQMQCHTCSKLLPEPTLDSVMSHWQAYHDLLPSITFGQTRQYFCDFCGKAFDKDDERAEHRRSKRHKAYTFFCPNCRGICKEKRSFEHHLTKFVPDKGCLDTLGQYLVIPRFVEPRVKGPVKCPYCSLTLKTHYIQRRHVNRLHKKETPSTCMTCGKTFPDKFRLDIHIETVHLQLQTHVCDTCGKLFGPKSIKKHSFLCKRLKSRTHSKYPYDYTVKKQCFKCGNMYQPTYLDTIHLERCTGKDTYARSLKCIYCYRAFKHQAHLECHLKTHSDSNHKVTYKTKWKAKTKDFQCELCCKCCNTAQALEVHLERHKNPFTCEMCNRPYLTRPALLFHQKTCSPEAGDLSVLKCPHCPKVMKIRTAYQAHLKMHERAADNKNSI